MDALTETLDEITNSGANRRGKLLESLACILHENITVLHRWNPYNADWRTTSISGKRKYRRVARVVIEYLIDSGYMEDI